MAPGPPPAAAARAAALAAALVLAVAAAAALVLAAAAPGETRGTVARPRPVPGKGLAALGPACPRLAYLPEAVVQEALQDSQYLLSDLGTPARRRSPQARRLRSMLVD